MDVSPMTSFTRPRLPGEPETTREYELDPGPRKWSKRAVAIREKRFNRVPEITARRFGLKERDASVSPPSN
jgi:hypothetical protein